MNTIYTMGFDAWGDGESLEQYLEGCRSSPKYRRGQWYVLAHEGSLYSSLLIHFFGGVSYGLGSIATELIQRKRGYASLLINEALKFLEHSKGAQEIFLYSDLKPEFYEKFGFKALPSNLQKYPSSICMVKVAGDGDLTSPKIEPPNYF